MKDSRILGGGTDMWAQLRTLGKILYWIQSGLCGQAYFSLWACKFCCATSDKCPSVSELQPQLNGYNVHEASGGPLRRSAPQKIAQVLDLDEWLKEDSGTLQSPHRN